VTGGRRRRQRGGVERKMEGEKDNYRECWSMQGGERVGDMPVVVGLGGGEKRTASSGRDHPLLLLLLLLHSLSLSLSRFPPQTSRPIHPLSLSLSPHLISAKAPQAPTVYLGGNIVTSGVV